jgi:ankyrin repeat protein
MTKAPTLLPYTGNNLVPLMAGGKIALQMPIQPIHTHTKAKAKKTTSTSTAIKSILISTQKMATQQQQKKPVDLLRSILHSSPSSSLSSPLLLSSSSKTISSDNKKKKKKIILSFEKPSEEDIIAYDLETVKAVRSNNVELLRKLWSNGEGKSMNACNQFGESVLHMACRRGYTKIVDFLLTEVKVRTDRCDDFGRNPFHDALWTPIPNFDVVSLLIEYADPLLMLSEDVRGNTPFAYARQDHTDQWIIFLEKSKVSILNRINNINTTTSNNNNSSCTINNTITIGGDGDNAATDATVVMGNIDLGKQKHCQVVG